MSYGAGPWPCGVTAAKSDGLDGESAGVIIIGLFSVVAGRVVEPAAGAAIRRHRRQRHRVTDLAAHPIGVAGEFGLAGHRRRDRTRDGRRNLVLPARVIVAVDLDVDLRPGRVRRLNIPPGRGHLRGRFGGAVSWGDHDVPFPPRGGVAFGGSAFAGSLLAGAAFGLSSSPRSRRLNSVPDPSRS